MQPLFTIEAAALPGSAEVVGFYGSEGLSRPYLFEVFVHVPLADAESVDLDAAIFTRASLRVHRDDGAIRTSHHGVIRAVEHLHDLTDTALYRLELVPALWLLSLGHHSRVYTDKSAKDVLEDTLRAGGMASSDYDLRLRGTFRPLAHVCQYRESDLDFLHRWMEREGVYYFFEHDGATEKLVLVNDLGDHAPLAPEAIRFFATGAGDASGREAMETFTARHAARPQKTRVTDHDPQRPSSPVRGEADVLTRGRGDAVRWSPHVITSAEAARLARLRAEERLAMQAVFSGSGRGIEVRPGFLFELDEHPLPAFNRSYLTVSVEHRGSQVSAIRAQHEHLGFTEDRAYQVRLTAIVSDRQYRAEHRTPWPRVHGLEPAVVDGPINGDYAQLDEHGRYLVRLRFDENAHQPGTASTRIRMMQPHAGEPEGMHFPLRKGTEVLIAFLGGDPDQPVIAGAVPDAEHPSVVVQANETQNVIHTGGNNRIEMEDTDAHQYIDLYSPPKHSALHLGEHHPRGYHGGHDHNFVLTTDGDGLIHTGANLDITVGGEKHEHVCKLVDEKYDTTQTTTVKQDVTEDYKSHQTTTVTGDCHEHFGTHTTAVRTRQGETVGTQNTTVRGALTETHGIQKTTVTHALTVHAGSQNLTGSTSSTQSYGSLAVNTTGGTTISCPAGITITAPNIHIVAPAVTCVTTTHTTAAPDHRIFKPFDTDTSATKLGMYAIQMQFTQFVKEEHYAVTMGISGIKIDNGLVKLDGAGIRCENTPTELKAGAFQLLRYGLMVIT